MSRKGGRKEVTDFANILGSLVEDVRGEPTSATPKAEAELLRAWRYGIDELQKGAVGSAEASIDA